MYWYVYQPAVAYFWLIHDTIVLTKAKTLAFADNPCVWSGKSFKRVFKDINSKIKNRRQTLLPFIAKRKAHAINISMEYSVSLHILFICDSLHKHGKIIGLSKEISCDFKTVVGRINNANVYLIYLSRSDDTYDFKHWSRICYYVCQIFVYRNYYKTNELYFNRGIEDLKLHVDLNNKHGFLRSFETEKTKEASLPMQKAIVPSQKKEKLQNSSSNEKMFFESHPESLQFFGCVFGSPPEGKLISPPLQKLPNIRNGDAKRELYRLTTFRHFPQHVMVNHAALARAGFYYTGTADHVQCFSCLNVTSAQASSNPFDPEMHRNECSFRTSGGYGSGNIPLDTASDATFNSNCREFPQRPAGNILLGLPNNTSPSRELNRPYQSAQPVGYPPVTPPILPEICEIPSSSQHLRQLQNSPTHEQLLRSLNLFKESDRLISFRSWPNSFAGPSPQVLAKEGFFYLGDHDRTECFSCGGILKNWNVSNDVSYYHLRSFPYCKMAVRQDARNIPNDFLPSVTSRNGAALSSAIQKNLREMFPCRNPLNPQMQRLELRLPTFKNWKFTQASPKQIAEAGFFSLNVQDRAKCFYCNGGLQNWCFHDDPWEEHAKWFPQCEYLLQCKGPEYVHAVTARYPHLKRPVMPNASHDVPPNSHRVHASAVSRQSTVAKTVNRENEAKNKLLNDSLEMDIAQTVIGMGFDIAIVRNVMKQRIDAMNAPYDSASDLLDAVLAYENAATANNLTEEPVNQTAETESKSTVRQLTGSVNSPAAQAQTCDANMAEHQATTGSSAVRHVPIPSSKDVEASEEDMKARLEQLMDERLCKVCLDAVADVVFIPCAHICCCVGCTRALRNCPICRQPIGKAIRTYTS